MTFKVTHDSGINRFFANVYMYLGFNLVIAGSVAYFVSENIEKFIFLYPVGIATSLIYMIGLSFILHALQSSLIRENSSWLEVCSLLVLFLSIEGILFAPFLIVYTSESIFIALGLAGGLLLGMSMFGLFSSTDLSSYFQTVMLGLFAIILFEIAAIWIFNFAINLQITSIGIILAMLFLIAYDMQTLRDLYYHNNNRSLTKLALFGSVLLFCNFIVLLQRILIIFGKKIKEE